MAMHMGAHPRPDGWGRRIISEGTNVPRKVLDLELPSHIRRVSGLLNASASDCVEKLYAKLHLTVPPRLTILELVHAQSAAREIEFEERLRVKANQRTDFDNIAYGLYKKSIFLDWRNRKDMIQFLENGQEPLNLTIDGRHYRVKKVLNEYVVELSNKNAIIDVFSHAFDLIRLRDLLETGCLGASKRYSKTSSSLASAEKQAWLANIFNYIEKYGDNPKINEIAHLLEERKGKKCAILCEGASMVAALSERFPSAFVTNHPAKTDMGQFDTIILATPGKHEVGPVWAIPGHEILVLVVKGTVDDERYWQNAKTSDSKQAFVPPKKNSIGGPELTLF